MRVGEGGSVTMLEFSLDETEKVIKAMKRAEEAGDLPALKWCARRLQWLYDEAGISSGDESGNAVRLFNSAWAAQIKSDPPPDIIAARINPPKTHYRNGYLDYSEDEIRIGNRSDALNLLNEMIGADMVMCTNTALEALRDAIEQGTV